MSQNPSKPPINDSRWRGAYRVARTSKTPGSAVEGPYKRSWNEWGDTLVAIVVAGIIAAAFLIEWLPTIVAAVVKLWRMS